MGQLPGGCVARVEENSAAKHLGIVPGDRVISVNGRVLRDELDYRFYISEEIVSIVVLSENGQEQTFEIEKDPCDLLGIAFKESIFDGVRTCKNNCSFCYVRQLPKNARKGLHLRDDDYRMSFLYGNFLSLTNLTGQDWARIIEQRLSPLWVSVHATDPEIRANLMGNPKASEIMEHLQRLVGAGIRVHVQIVLLKGINDGRVLEKTLSDLELLGDSLVTVGVVPAVYTRFRKSAPSKAMDPVWAGEILELIEQYASNVWGKRGDYWVYGADEFYIAAGRSFPCYKNYGDFHQYHNGIGNIPDFRHRLETLTERVPPPGRQPGTVCRDGPAGIVVTGKMAYPELVEAVKRLGLSQRFSVCPVPNVFFGSSVTCAGLLTGQDILAAVLRFLRLRGKGEGRYDILLIPEICLRDGLFLDNMTVEDIRGATGLEVRQVLPTPEGLLEGFGRREGR